jgi:diguanylate cyclase (GGDEF)-like protein
MPSLTRADLYRSAVGELGHSVVVVRDGQDAYACLTERGAPALLVVDLSLPKLDAFALLKQLRRETPSDRTSVIVVSAYEPLRVAARGMTDALGITSILPADADRHAVIDAVSSALRAPAAVPEPPAARGALPAAGPRHATQVQDALAQALLEASRRFPAPVCLAFLKVGDHERFAVHLAVHDAAPPVVGAAEWALVRQLAQAGEPLVLADLQSQPLIGEALGAGGTAFHGFAGVPLFREHVGASGAICLADLQPGTLGAADLDNLELLAAELEKQIESTLGHARPAAAPITTTIDVDTLERLAVTDPLTGLANRRGGERSVASEISRARRQKSPLSCIFIDIDHFKRINDTFGHQAGDRLLRDLSELLRRTLRAYDILVRWGGEEFLLILPGVTLDQARKLAERIRAAVERLETQGLGRVTISAGTAALDGSYDFEAMLDAADRRLYQAKASGRNAVV